MTAPWLKRWKRFLPGAVLVVFLVAGVAKVRHHYVHGNAEVVTLAARIQLGDRHADVETTFQNAGFSHITLVRHSETEWLAGNFMWPGNWVLWIEFESSRVRALRFRLYDDRDAVANGAPPDRSLQAGP